MTDFSKTVNYAAKDALIAGDPNKIIKGTELDVEFENIETSSATKANKVAGAVLNDIVLQSSTGDMKAAGWGFPNVNADITASDEELNLLDGFTGTAADIELLSGADAGGLTAAELLYVAGVTSDIQTQIDASASTADITALADGSSGETISPDALAQWNGMSLGDGSDGAWTINTNTTKDSGIYYLTSLDVQAAQTLDVTETEDGFLFLFVQGTATIAGTIDLDGVGGSGGLGETGLGAGDATTGTTGRLGGGGGGGGDEANSTAQKGGRGLLTTAGGVKGTNSDGSAGEDPTVSKADHMFYAMGVNALPSNYNLNSYVLTLNYTGGGGGGGGGSNGGASGDGGNGGGGLIIYANEIVFTGTINATGSAGAASGSAGAGGGGGGGGVYLFCRTLTTNTGTIDVSGGAGGVGTPADCDGGAGGAGLAKVSALPIVA